MTHGEYMKANSIADIIYTFNKFLINYIGSSTIIHKQGYILPDEKQEHIFWIDEGMEDFHLSCVWKGSTIGLQLFDPKGREINKHTPRVEWLTSERYVSVKINNPLPGKWLGLLTGIDIPGQGEIFIYNIDGNTPIIYNIEEIPSTDNYIRLQLDQGKQA